MTVLQKGLNRFLRLTTWKPWLTISVAFALAAICVLYTVSRLGFETSQLSLISPKNRLVKLTDNLDQFKDLDPFVVVIDAPTPSQAVLFLKSLVPRLEKDTAHFQKVFYKVNVSSLRKWSLLYLDKKELGTLRANISDHIGILSDLNKSADLNTLFSLINREMTSKMMGHLFTDFLEADSNSGDDEKPLDLSYLINLLDEMLSWFKGNRIYNSPWGAFFGKDDWEGDLESYLWTNHKRYLLSFVTPKTHGDGFNDEYGSIKQLRKTIHATLGDFPNIKVGVTGQKALNTDQMAVGLRDMSIASLLSLIGLTILLIVFWKSVTKPLLEITELLLALSWTFGLTTLFIGHLNILSMIFAPLLLGLGIDYGIHWLARYEEALHSDKSRPVREIVVSTMTRIGPAILVAGSTAALSFLPLALTNFKGLQELGLISAMGMIMTTITTLGVLPSLVLTFERKRTVTSQLPVNQHGCTKLSLASCNGENVGYAFSKYKDSICKIEKKKEKVLFRLKSSRALLILGASLLLTGFSAMVVKNVHFDLNLLQLQPKGTESVDWEMKLLRNSKRSALYAAAIASTPGELISKAHRFKKLPTVSKVQDIFSYLPENQKPKLLQLKQMAPLISGIPALKYNDTKVDLGRLDETLGSIRFKMSPEEEDQWGKKKPLESQMIKVRELISGIRTYIKSNKTAEIKNVLEQFENKIFLDLADKMDLIKTGVLITSPMQISDLPKYLHDQYVGKTGKYLIRVYPKENVWQSEVLKKFVTSLRGVDPDVIGDPVTLFVFTRAFRQACINAAIYAVLFIFVLLLLTFRSLQNTLLAMTPLILGTLWTIGLMWCFGVNFNLANSIFLPLIVGAGVEYGIVILNRWFQEGNEFTGLPMSTGKGIILAALTTTIGFGSLMISHHRGINSLGMLATIGSITVMLSAVVVLPTILFLRTRKRYQERSEVVAVKVN